MNDLPESKRLATLPFAEQLEHLAARVSARAELPSLVAETAALADHQPFAALCRSLLEAELLSAGPCRRAFGEALEGLPDTGVQRLLRTLDESETLHGAAGAALARPLEAIVEALLERLPVERVAAICLLDRWLKGRAPGRREALLAAAEAHVRGALTAGSVEALEGLDDATLLALPAARLSGLAQLATAQGPALAAAWRERLGRFAARVLSILEAQPKSLSQANAEQLLARRVYTDPGHFLVELLQNADDAGAQAWRLQIRADAVDVWHDGLPFDAKDVVGVLSIGQTTKDAGQIGFFGVGFKAVYEICERPQIYSEPFDFEIADVSIPRLLSRPEGMSAEGTLLRLPFRRGEDAARAVALQERALALPPQTLLTLQSLEALELQGPERGRRIRCETLTETRTQGASRISERSLQVSEEAAGGSNEVSEVTRYRVAEGRYRRGEAEATALVAVALGGEPLGPVALPGSAPTLFAFLPTSERSGLRVLIHAAFRLPVDRERLDPEAADNRAALRRAGELLADLVVDDARTRQRTEEPPQGRWLEVLPRRQELRHDGYGVILEGLAEGLAEASFLPAADGRPGGVSPRQGWIAADPALVELLAHEDLDALAAEDGERGAALLEPLPPREEALARELGVRTFGLDALLRVLEDHLAAQWQVAGVVPRLISEELLTCLGRLWRRAPRAEKEAAEERLRALPWLPDEGGALGRPGDLWRGPARLRAVYGGSEALLAAPLEAPREPALGMLLDELRVPVLDDAKLLADLGDEGKAALLMRSSATHAVFEAIGALPPALRRDERIPRAAAFPDHHGEHRALLGPDALHLGSGDELEVWLRELSSEITPLRLCDEALQRDYGGLLVSLGAKAATLERVLARFVGEPELARGLPRRQLLRLHELLVAGREERSPRLAARLAEAPLFPTLEGVMCPLVGVGRALLPQDEAIVALAREAPWLTEEPLTRELARSLVEPLGADAVARTLLLEGDHEPLFDPLAVGPRSAALGYLAEHAEALSGALLARLATAPLWRDEAGEERPLSEHAAVDHTLPASDELAALYRGASFLQSPLAAEDRALALALGLAAALVPLSPGRLLEDLAEAPREHVVALPEEQRQATLLLVAEHLEGLDPAQRELLEELPLFADEAGQARALGRWEAALDDACGRAHRCSGPLRPLLGGGSRVLLDEPLERRLVSLWSTLGIAPAGLGELLSALADDPALATEERRGAARRHLTALARGGPGALRPFAAEVARLPLWPDEHGRLFPPGDLLSPTDCERALGSGWRELVSGMAILAEDAAAEAAALDELLRFADPLEPLGRRLKAEARLGEALSAQPPFLRDRARLAALLASLSRDVDLERAAGAKLPQELAELPLLADRHERLCTPPRYRVEADEAALLANTPLFEVLLDDELGRVLGATLPGSLFEAVAPTLPLRTLLATLGAATELGLEGPAGAPRRAALYRLLQRHGATIAGDEQAKGVLGRARLFVDREGRLRSPRELLLVDRGALPELAALAVLGACPADEIPADVVAWIGATYALDARQSERVLEELLSAYGEARGAQDVEQAAVLLEAMAQSLRATTEGTDEVALAAAASALPTRIKLHRQLRVPCVDGRWVRPRALLLADAETRELLGRALVAAPPSPVEAICAARRPRALLLACGAPRTLDGETLAALLAGEGLVPGVDAALALARLVVAALSERPALLQELDLQRRRWIPNGEGAPRGARELLWPDARGRALFGDDPALYPHPELAFALPTLRRQLHFCEPEVAPLEQLLAVLEARSARGQGASPEQLSWLEEGLRVKRLTASEVRQALYELPFLVDDRGVLRAPMWLCREGAAALLGDRFGDFEGARRHRRLTSALGIASQPGPRHGRQLLTEVAAEAGETADLLLADEPELLESLPRALSLWAQRPQELLPSPSAVALLARRCDDGRALLCVADDPRLGGELEPVFGDESDVTPVKQLLARLRGEEMPGAVEGTESTETTSPEVTTETTSTAAEPNPGLLTRVSRWFRRSPAPRVSERRKQEDQTEQRETAPPATPNTRAQRRQHEREERRREAELTRARRAAEAEARKEQARQRREQRHQEARQRRGDGPRGAGSAAQSSPAEVRPLGPRGVRLGPRGSAMPSPGEAPPEERSWFRPRQSIDEQLGGQRDWLADRGRAPAFGFSHAPRSLPAPWLYAPQLVSARFDASVQRWLPVALSSELFAGEEPRAGLVEVNGQIPAGEVILPMPAFSRVVTVDCDEGSRWVGRDDGAALVISEESQPLAYVLELRSAPAFGRGDGAFHRETPHRALLELTVDDDELPAELLEALAQEREALRSNRSSALAVAQGLRGLIQRRYRYDPSYLEDPQLAAWLRSLALGRKNMHLAALHAGRDARHLGRGVCYELNALLCEVLRRVGIPAAVASGWTFDRGILAEPDHLWTLALLPTPLGPRFLPLDASTTRAGRPLHAASRPPGSWGQPRRGGAAPRAPSWGVDKQQRRSSHRGASAAREDSLGEVRMPPERELMAVLRYLGVSDDEVELRARARELLASEDFIRSLDAS